MDSLVLQGVLTQELDFTTTPLDYALLERSLGPARTMAWFPVLPPRAVPQSPYDPGPYRYRGVAPIAAQASVATATAQPAPHRPGSRGTLWRRGRGDRGRFRIA